MAEDSGISWTHSTWNPWVGCDKVAPECAKCYIGREIRKQRDWLGYEGKPIKGSNLGRRQPWGKLYLTQTWSEPWKWEAECIRNRYAKRVFTCSLSDFFHAKADPWRRDAWAIIKRTPHLVWLVLTKRPELIEAHLPQDWGKGYPNVWLGVSVGCREKLNKMDYLRCIPAAVRWVSAEPLIEDISQDINLKGFGWVVVGGESGWGKEYFWDPKSNWKAENQNEDTDGRRTMRYQWAANLRDKVKAAGLPFMFKQVTAPRSGFGYNALDDEDWHEFPPAPSGVGWAPRQEIPEKCKMTANQIHAFKSGETYPFRLPTVRTIQCRRYPPLPSQYVIPELVPLLLISFGVNSKEAITDFIEKHGERLTWEEMDRLNGWIEVLQDELLDKAKTLKGSSLDAGEVPGERKECPTTRSLPDNIA